MKSDSTALQHLNQVFAAQLQGINQNFVMAKILQHWGMGKLASHLKICTAAESTHAELIAERILLLSGTPEIGITLKSLSASNAHEILQNTLKQWEKTLAECKRALLYLESIRDYGSSALLKQQLAVNEQNIAWAEQQLSLITTLGLNIYLQQQL